MNIEDIKKAGETLRNKLSLRTYPLGIRFCKGEELPAKARTPHKDFGIRMATCQAINMSRTYGYHIVMKADDQFCMISAALFGMIEEVPEYFMELIYPWHTKNMEIGKNVFNQLFKRRLSTNGTYSIAIGPLARIRFEPHIAVIYGSPTQIAKIAKACTWCGDLPDLTFLGVAACSSITSAYLTGNPKISIPCAGELILGRTEEDEVYIAFPIEKLGDIIKGLEHTDFIMPYPVTKYISYEPIVPDEYKISYKHYIEWKRKGKD